jgi:hypothetical protein
VDEILTLVNIALGNATVADCRAGDANHDGQITIDEILTAVNNALNGCIGGAALPSSRPASALLRSRNEITSGGVLCARFVQSFVRC